MNSNAFAENIDKKIGKTQKNSKKGKAANCFLVFGIIFLVISIVIFVFCSLMFSATLSVYLTKAQNISEGIGKAIESIIFIVFGIILFISNFAVNGLLALPFAILAIIFQKRKAGGIIILSFVILLLLASIIMFIIFLNFGRIFY